MKTITLNNKKYICPENWNQVTLKMQMKVSEDTDKISVEELKKFAILSGYAGIPVAELKKAKLTDLTELFKAIAFINKPLEEKSIIEFDFNGKHYYAGQNIAEMEFQDFISIENTLTEYSGNTYQALPTILAIMCKQKKDNGMLESIDDYDIKARAKEFEDLPLTIANNLSLFFSSSVRLYSNLSLLFSKPETIKEAMEKQIDSVENTLKEFRGKGLLMRCASGILRYYIKYIRRQLHKHYTSIQ